MLRLLRLLSFALAAAPLLAAGQPANLGDARLVPIDDPLRIEFHVPPADLSPEKMRQTISIVAAARGWKTVGEGAGTIRLTRVVNGKHEMNIELAYDPVGYDIRYLGSIDLLYREVALSGTSVRAIHRNYNRWIRELAASINAALAVGASMSVASTPRAAAPAASAAAAAIAPKTRAASNQLPQPGDYWKYSFRDERYRRRVQHFTVEVAEVEGWTVSDLLAREDSDGALRVKRKIDARQLAFVGRRLHEDYSTLELAPYLAVSEQMSALQPGQAPGHVPSGWKARVTGVAQERVVVPAGSFDATRVEVTSDAQLISGGSTGPLRRIYTLWYAAEPKRYVMLRQQVWAQNGSLSADEIVRLEEYRLK